MNLLKKSTRQIIVLALLFLCLFQNVQAQVQTAKPGVSMISNSGGFYQYLPQGYSATGSQTYPLIIMLHGIGELGDGSASKLPMVLRNGVPKLINAGTFPTSISYNGEAFKFIVITPQFKKWPTAADIGGVISYCQSHYKVDASRIYLTGISMGGGTLWTTIGSAALAPKIAAAVIFAGAWSPTQAQANVIADNNIGVWAFHNSGDGTVASSNTINWIKDIQTRKSAAPVKKTIFSATPHDCWSNIYPGSYTESGLNIYQFLLKYKKGTVVAPTTTPAASTTTAATTKPKTFYATASPKNQSVKLPANSVSISGKGTIVGGTIAKYRWSEVSGPASFTIKDSTAASTTVSNLVAGTYTFRLSITTTTGIVTSDKLTITVTGTSAATTTATAKTTGTLAATPISVNPDPITDKFVLTVNTDQTGTMKVQLINASGSPVRTYLLQKLSSGICQSYLTAGDLPAGNYTIKAQVGSFTETIPVVKK